MDDKELVEVWRAEFIELNSHVYPPYMVYNHGDRKFNFDGTECMWQGFLLAKRSQPEITVPAYDMHHSAPVRNLMAKMDSAGIKYTIGE